VLSVLKKLSIPEEDRVGALVVQILAREGGRVGFQFGK
jgi:hypothetical protein